MNNYNQRPGYYPPPYAYNYPPYAHPPYPPAAPYGMPAPTPQPMATPQPMVTPKPLPAAKPVPNYSYYSPHVAVEAKTQAPYMSATPPLYAQIPYSQTRMATPSPFVYPSQTPPGYNYTTTNMIARLPPPQATNLYPYLGQMHTYPVNAKPSNNVSNMQTTQTAVRMEPTRDSVESNTSRKSSEVSIVVFFWWWLI